jgi:hypothetical protein
VIARLASEGSKTVVHGGPPDGNIRCIDLIAPAWACVVFPSVGAFCLSGMSYI